MKPLWPYQREGARWLSNRRFALLADDMGLGKTAQFITALDLIHAETVLVIPPAAVRFVWEDQIAEWSMFGHETNVMTTSKDRPVEGQVNVVNYDLLARGFEATSYRHNDFLKAITNIRWDVTICDEAHFLKEQTSLRTQAVLLSSDPRTGKPIKSIATSTKRLWLGTGTPMPNGPWELWTILMALNAINMTYDDFIKRYCIMGHGYQRFEPIAANPATADELKQILGSVMMRRLKEFVLPQLPKLRIEDLPVPQVKIKVEDFFEEALINRKQVMEKIKAEEEFVQEVISRVAYGETGMDTSSMISALEAVGASVSFYRRWLGSVKAVSTLPIIRDELENNAVDKLVIFAYSRQVMDYLSVKLSDFQPLMIRGGMTDTKRRNVIADFKDKKEHRVNLIQIIAGGTGLDGLQHACHEAINIEPDWTPMNNAQPVGRLHRMGQKWPVRVRMARLKDSLDDYIGTTCWRKTLEICRIVGN